MKKHLYKRMLNSIPTAVVVVDENLQVRFSNLAFKQYFSPKAAPKGSLRDVTCCAQSTQCGALPVCARCGLRKLFLKAVHGNGITMGSVHLTVENENTVEDVNFSVRIKPLHKGLLLGTIDQSYEQELAKELRYAERIQQRLLPSYTEAGGVRFSYMYEPCRAIGGDMPDVYAVDQYVGDEKDTFGLIADVSGMGISAGILATFVKAAWDKKEPSPAVALTKMSRKFSEMNQEEHSYITVAACRINQEDRTLTYGFAGHVVPMLLKHGDTVREIVIDAPPVSNWFADFTYGEQLTAYGDGDTLVMLTDGVVDSRSPDGKRFSLDRVKQVLLKSADAKSFIALLKTAVNDFCETQEDDMTAIAFDL